MYSVPSTLTNIIEYIFLAEIMDFLYVGMNTRMNQTFLIPLTYCCGLNTGGTTTTDDKTE